MEESLLKSLIECAICCDYLNDLVETPCCHNLFCKTCLLSWNSSNTSCPSCRKPLTFGSCITNVPIQRFLDNMPMDCPNKLKGCDSKPTRSSLEKHRELCPFSIAAVEEQRSQKSKQLRTKMDELLKSHSRDPKHLQSLCNLGKEMLEVGDYKGASELGKLAAKLAKESRNINMEIEATFLIALVDQAEARYDHALFLFEEAKQLSMKGNKAKQADCFIHIGEIYIKRGKFKEAETIYRQALPLSEETGGKKSPLVGEIFNCLGMIAKKNSEYDKSIKFYNDALKIIGVEHHLYFEVVSNLADVHRKKENFKEARELYTQTLQKIKSVYGENHPQVAEVSNALGMLNKKEGRYDEALTCYKTALQIGKYFFGASHPSIGVYLTNLGDIYRKQGNFNKAEGIYSQALPLLEKSLGMEHVEVAEVLNSMGLVLKKRADYEGAEKLYRRAIAIIEKSFGNSHYKIGIYLNNLADTDRKRARFPSALDMYKRALGIIEKNLGKTHSEGAEIMYNMGLVYHQLEDYKEAIRNFNNALQIVIKEFGPRHYKIGMIMNSKGMAEMMLNNFEEAYKNLNDGLAILLDCLGKDHVEVADCYSNLGDVCMKLTQELKRNQLDEAKKNYKEASRILEKAFGSTHTKCQQLESLLFICDAYNSLLA